jgi:hypothetical protein
LNILDRERALHGTICGTEIDGFVAALSASPTTIGELQNALARFAKPKNGINPFDLFDSGTNEEPCDAGISFIDLEAHILAADSIYSNPQTNGTILYHDGIKLTNIRVTYYVPDNWLLLNSIAEYKCIRDLRRAQFAASPPLDARAVLYGKVVDYIVQECLSSHASRMKDPISNIHVRWLTTARDDLRGQSPRSIMLEQREFLEADMQSREDQWSRLGEPPPCLDPKSAAYRFAGFGTHEIVVYYDLVRFLIKNCWKRVNKKRSISIPVEAARLQELQSKWLARPEKDFENKSAAYVIECERKRLPLAVRADESIFDDNCPICRQMAKHAGPVFCHFDGCNMDDDFPFSLFLTREEWEENRLVMAEIETEFDGKQQKQGQEPFDQMNSQDGAGTTVH